MGEHLDFHKASRRTTDVLVDYCLVYLFDLMEIQLPGKDDDVGEPGVEAQRLHVRNAQLRGNVYLNAKTAAVGYGGHVGSDDSRDAGSLCCFERLAHRLEVFLVEDDVQRQIGLHPVVAANAADLRKIVGRKIVRRMRAHVEVAHSKIDGVRPTLNRRM